MLGTNAHIHGRKKHLLSALLISNFERNINIWGIMKEVRNILSAAIILITVINKSILHLTFNS